jgi:hypothetical protein
VSGGLDGMLVVGSSDRQTGFRFVQIAARAGLPMAAANLGRTRADQMLVLKVEQACESALAVIVAFEPHARERAFAVVQ